MLRRGRGPDMVLILGGAFVMNRHELEFQQTTIDVASFYLDRTEVTVAEYSPCVDAGACTAPEPSAIDRCVPPHLNFGHAERAQHPINCVQWAQADAFCRWAHKRLPTEAEWEYAAGGRQGTAFPWGDEPASNQTCWSGARDEHGLLRRESTCPVASHPREHNGLFDMSGNVIEWTFGMYCRGEHPRYDCREERRGLRGGHWDSSFEEQLTGTVSWQLETKARLPFVGFRCARDLTPD